MGRPYSLDLRERVVRAVMKGGLSCHQAAAQFGVGISTAINWVRRFRETGFRTARSGGSATALVNASKSAAVDFCAVAVLRDARGFVVAPKTST